ncbi:MAG: hypothetical protein ACPL6C_02620 [bacterium]
MRWFFKKFIVLLLVELAYGQGIELNYRDFTFIDVKLGFPVELEPRLRVKNTGELEREIVFRLVDVLEDYYEPILSPSYLILPEPFVLKAGEEKEVSIYFNAPRETRNYNRRWVAGVEVESRASVWEPFSLSVVVSLKIETESEYIPQQMIFVSPSMIKVRRDDSFSFWLANLTFLPDTVELTVAPPYPADFILRRTGYSRTIAFAKIDKRRFFIKEGEKIKVDGRVKVPPTYGGEKLENIIFVSSKRNKDKGFIRVFLDEKGGVEDEK